MKNAGLIRLVLAAAGLGLIFSDPAGAVTITADGVVLITQADALAGGVTPGDTAGFPVTLSVAGSYRLASNIVPGAGQEGLSVTGPEVTIDFNGFRINGGGQARSAIVANARGLTLKNGSIRGFVFQGIVNDQAETTIENMRISASSTTAVEDRGGFLRITNSHILNSGVGIVCQQHCYVAGNTVSGHAGIAIVLQKGGSVLGNVITGNGGKAISGSSGFITGIGDNTISNNGATSTFVTPMGPNACNPAC